MPSLLPRPGAFTDPALARPWLVRLRWGALAAQGVTVLFAARSLGARLPLAPVLALLGLTAVSNLGLARSRHPQAIPAMILLDLGVQTALLALCGGASNPFSVLYLVYLTLTAVLLGPRWTWGVAIASTLGFALLFLFNDPHLMHGGEGRVQAHLLGMWAAFALAGGGIAWFVGRLARVLGEREIELARLRRQTETQERVLALATLAAGAAHELGSPLAAIAVGAREIEVLAGERDPEVAGEARAVRAQVERCKGIIGRLSQRAGAAQAEPPAPVRLDQAWAAAQTRLVDLDTARVTARSQPEDLVLVAPPEALAEALASLVRNALQAGAGAVLLVAAAEGDGVRITVTDRGVGMAPEVLARVGEPFYPTRAPGVGMGLGVFLSRRFAEGLGGALDLDSAPGQGTVVTLRLPAGSA